MGGTGGAGHAAAAAAGTVPAALSQRHQGPPASSGGPFCCIDAAEIAPLVSRPRSASVPASPAILPHHRIERD